MSKKISPLLAVVRFPRIKSRGFLGLAVVSLISVVLFLHTPGMAPMQTTAVEQWSLGYWTPMGHPPIPPSAIEWGGLTHVVHWAALVQSDGSLDLTTQLVTTDGPTLISTAHSHGVKVLLGVSCANWLGQCSNMALAITNNLSTLVSNIMNVVNSYGFDGVDIDWEGYNVSTNGPNQTALASALRTQLGTQILTVAVAVCCGTPVWAGANQALFDRIQIMTYDLGNPAYDPYSWHNAALYGPTTDAVWSLDKAVRQFETAGVPASKLSIGIPFFGWQWSGGGITAPRQHWSTPPRLQQIYYQGLASLITTQNYHRDSMAQVPYLSIDGSGLANIRFITYDDTQSVAAKVDYAKSQGLGGWIIWELSADYLPAQTPNQPLLTAIKNKLEGLKALSDYAPGLIEFSPGVVAAQDTSFNGIGPSNPAKRGQTIALYANGLGPVTNQPASGQVALSSPLSETVSTPTVTIGGQQAAVSFSGLSPGYASLYQINVVVPQSLSPGNYPITVSIGGRTANTSGINVQ